MAAKIREAILASDGQTKILANKYEKEKHGDVLCPDGRCMCQVEGVHATHRNIKLKGTNEHKQIDVDAFFRLPKNAEKSGRGHSPRCKFDIEASIKKLVKKSNEIKNFDKDFEPLLLGLRGKPAIFRLHILMEILRSLHLKGLNPEEDERFIGRALRGNKYVTTSGRLRPYFRMAKAILSVIARVQMSEYLEKWIQIRYGNLLLPWSQYFFEESDHGALYEYLLTNEQFSSNPGTNRPVAVVVKLSGKPPRLTEHKNWEILGEIRVFHRQSLGKFAVRPRIYTKKKEIAEEIAKEQYVLLCAVPTTERLSQPENKKLKPSARIRFTIIDRSQICRYPKTMLSRPL